MRARRGTRGRAAAVLNVHVRVRHIADIRSQFDYSFQMSELTQRSTGPSRIGCVFALALIFAPAIAVTLWVGQLPGEEWPFALFYGVLLALPFGYLALDGTKNRLPLLVVIVLTALFWGALIVSTVNGARDQTGVNFGMGLIMLASPLVTTLGAWLANRRA